jgi:hypothetical protein
MVNSASPNVVGISEWKPMRLLAFTPILYVLSVHVCYAEDNPLPARAVAATTQGSAMSSIELWLAGAIIAFGFIVLFMQFILLRRTANTQPEDILRLFTVTMIIIGTLALIAIGYSSQQIAPALGLFGTVLGYLLGKTDERIRARRLQASEPAPPEGPGT